MLYPSAGRVCSLATDQANGDTPFEIMGPAAANVVKVMNRYRYTLTLSGKSCRKMRDMISYIITRAKGDKRNRGISITVDFNPVDSI